MRKNVSLCFIFFLIGSTSFKNVNAQMVRFVDTIYYNDKFITIDEATYYYVKENCPKNEKGQIILTPFFQKVDTLPEKYDIICESFEVIDIVKNNFTYKKTKYNLKKVDSYILTLYQMYPLRRTFQLIVFYDTINCIPIYKIGGKYNMTIKSVFSYDFFNVISSDYTLDIVIKKYLILDLHLTNLNLYILQ